MFKLLMEQGDQPGKEFILREGANLIGRSREVDIRLTGEDISGSHARVDVQGRKVWVENISRFGTWVQGRKLEKEGDKAEAVSGQQIRLGKGCVLLLKEDPLPATAAGDDTTLTYVAKETVVPPSDSSDVDATVSPAPMPPTAPSPAQAAATVDDSQAAATPPSSGSSADFERVMRAKAEAAKLDTHESESADGKTQVQKTRFAPEEELVYRRDKELRLRRRKLLATLTVLVLGSVLFAIFQPRQRPEGKLEWDQAYQEGTQPVPRGGYSLVYPKNETSRVENTADGLIIATRLGRKRDVPLIITLSEKVADRWALQDSAEARNEWMRSNPDKMFNRPGHSPRFEGAQNGVRIWDVSYKKGEWAGRANLFCDGRRVVVLCVEIPAADQARAENFLSYSYFDFPPEFEEKHWEGCVPSRNISAVTLLQQVREDLQREAPSTWMILEADLRTVLSKAVAEKLPEQEKQAMELLVSLRKKEAVWFNGQLLQVVNARRFQDKDRLDALIRRGLAVFSDMNDRRYDEVRSWQRE